MTKCYEAFCEPFFSTKCKDVDPSWEWRLDQQRNKFIESGIRFDKTQEDKDKFLAFSQSKPHVAQAKGVSEWYTPLIYIEAARQVMGSIMVDPASSDKANEIVQADLWYTKEDDGLKQEWAGTVWMNPPYSQPLVQKFCNLFVEKFKSKEITEGCVLVNNATETAFFQNMLEHSRAVCFIKGRVRFLDEEGEAKGAPLQGQSVLYFGTNYASFESIFSSFGVVLHAKR